MIINKVHCRIGSLEKFVSFSLIFIMVHCRIGSLEKSQFLTTVIVGVHCRIGSLEIPLRLHTGGRQFTAA